MVSNWLGWLSFGLCIALMLKFILRKSKASSLNLLFKKLHIPFGITLLAAGLLHTVITLAKWQSHIQVIATGIIAMALILFVSLTYVFRRSLKKKWMYMHRAGTLVAIPFIFAHLFLALK